MNPADKPQHTPTMSTVLHGHQGDNANKALHTYRIDEIIELIRTNAGFASALVGGLMSAADKQNLDTVWNGWTGQNAKLTALQTAMFPIIIPAPVNTVMNLLFNVTGLQYEVLNARAQTASGTIKFTLSVDGTPITGLNGVTASSSGATLQATNAANRVISANQRLTLTLEDNAAAAGLMITLQMLNKTAAEA